MGQHVVVFPEFCRPITELKILESFPKARVPDNNEWRLPMLKRMLEIRLEKDSSMENTDDLSKMIDSLCNS